MASKKSNKKIQRRFVEARAAGLGLEYEDLTLEQRERFQDRFQTLSQTVEGRGKIARRILGPDAPQESRRALRQRIRQNLPDTELPGTDLGDAGPTITSKQMTMRDFRRAEMQTSDYQRGDYARAGAEEARKRLRTGERATGTKRVTVTTQDRDTGGGIFGNIKKAASAVGGYVQSELEYQQRAYVNPVINLAGRVSDVIGNKGPGQKFKPLPQLSDREVFVESGVVVLTAGAAKVIPGASAAARSAISSAGKAIGRRGAVRVGAAIANPAQRAIARSTARQQVQSQLARQELGERMVSKYSDVFSDIVPSRVTPAPSGVKRTTPPATGTKRTTPTSQTASKPKVKQKRISKADQPFLEDLSADQRYDIYSTPAVDRPVAQPVQPANQKKQKAARDLARQRDIEKKNKLPAKPKQQSTSTPEQIKSFLKMISEGTETVTLAGGKKVLRVKDTRPIYGPQPTPPLTAKAIEIRTEKYAPGFGKNFGDIEMRSTEYEPLEAIERIVSKTETPKKAPKPTSVKKLDQPPLVSAKVDNAMEPLEIPASPRSEPALPKPKRVSKKPTQKKSKSEVATPQKQTPVEITMEEADILRLYPSSARAREIYRRQSGIKDYVPGTGRADIPVQREKPFTYTSLSVEEFKRVNIPKPKEPLGFVPIKRTKLPSQSEAMNRLEEKGSMLFRMYDRGIGSGKRPGGPAGEMNTGLSAQQQVDDLISPISTGQPVLTKSQEQALKKQIDEVLQDEAAIRTGRSINPRYRRAPRKDVAEGTMEMPTSMSKADLRVTYGLKKAETGKSLEQRQSDFFRSLYPDAKSTAEARKRYARDMGIDPRKLARSPIGSPLGRLAQKSPVGIARKKVPVAFEEITTVVGGKVKTVKKPIKFKTEESPGIQTLFSAPGQFTPIEDIQEAISSGRIITDMQKIRGGAMETKAATFKSRAEMASRLRNRGLAGEARGREYTRRKKAVEEGKQFQTRFDELTKQNVDQLMGLPAPQPTKIFKNKKRKKK